MTSIRCDYKSMPVVCLLCSGAVFLASCDHFTEPQPAFNKNTSVAEIKPYPQLRAEFGDTVTDTLRVSFLPGPDSSNISLVGLYVDWDFVASSSGPPYGFVVDTKLWANGRHQILFGIFKSDRDGGLLKLIDYPSIIDTSSLQFRHRPAFPVNVTNGTIMYTPKHPIIYWGYPSRAEADVMYFIVRRHPIYIYAGSDTVVEFQDTIFNHAHSYMDTSITTMGWHPYSVGAANAYGISYTYSGGASIGQN